MIIERAAGRRSGGYFVALFGAGKAAARRLGILEHLRDRASSEPGLDIDRTGSARPGMTYADMPGEPWLMLRGDVEQAAFATLPEDVEVRYSTVPTAIAGSAFGEQPPGNTLGAVLEVLENTDDVLFDSVEQVRMDAWHTGRVVLVGDSAWCVTLYAGMGVSSALAAADLLGAMLEQNPDDMPGALAEWERGLRLYIDHYQDAAPSDRRIFVVDNRLQIQLRRIMPVLGKTKLGRRLADRIMRVDEIITYKNADIVGTVLDAPPRHREETRVA